MNEIESALGARVSGLNEYADYAIHLMIFCGITIGVTICFLMPASQPALVFIQKHTWASSFIRPSMLWFFMGMVLLMLRTLLWTRYRPFAPATELEAPFLTVVIPAYNEGALVRRSIVSAAIASYPRGKLEIIVVDDGSRDDTWKHIEAAANEHPGIVRTIRFAHNNGKRAALAAGFEQARGDIVITMDSDSIIEPGALLAIAGPFRDETVGAVGGKVVALNRFESLLPRMLHVRYMLSFDFLRSAQSSYGAVYCCPGALTAYRMSLVRRALPSWLKQQFLGTLCNTGEDRALTNDILGLGYRTVYQRSAIVHTLVPTTYTKLCRMYLRWNRSYVREEIRLFRFICWKLRPKAMLITLLDKTITNLRFPVAWLSLGLMVIMSVDDPWTIMRVILAIGVASSFYMLYFLKSERSWEFVFGVFYAYFSAFTLFWIFPYALMTLRNRSWMTR